MKFQTFLRLATLSPTIQILQSHYTCTYKKTKTFGSKNNRKRSSKLYIIANLLQHYPYKLEKGARQKNNVELISCDPQGRLVTTKKGIVGGLYT
jgi:hypothetical protein